jgi:hypothetical protein
MARNKIHTPIIQQLLREDLVTEEQLTRCRRLFANNGKNTLPQHTLFRLDSPFLVDFSSSLRLTIVGDAVYADEVNKMFSAYTKSLTYRPWSGRSSDSSGYLPSDALAFQDPLWRDSSPQPSRNTLAVGCFTCASLKSSGP